jgi:hypothetical protein
MVDDEWVVLAQHMRQIAWNPIDGPTMDLLALEDGLRDQGIDTGFLPYRPGDEGGFTDAVAQPLQLMVKRQDAARAHDIAIELLGADCDMLV